MIILYEEEQGFVGLSFDSSLNVYIMHVDLYRWSASEFKRYLKIFEVIKKHVKELTPEVYSLCDNEKEYKFNKMFGFEDTGYKAEDSLGNICIIGRLKL
jgi:hypothetical protein